MKPPVEVNVIKKYVLRENTKELRKILEILQRFVVFQQNSHV